jgi:hypothetical protein
MLLSVVAEQLTQKAPLSEFQKGGFLRNYDNSITPG